MEKKQEDAQAQVGAYERWLRLFKQYMPYVIIIALCYALKYKDDRLDKSKDEMRDHLNSDIEDKKSEAAEWKRTNDNQNEILKNVLDKFQPAQRHD